MNKRKSLKISMGTFAARLLKISVVPIITVFICLTYSFIKEASVSPACAMLFYPDMFSYVYSAILLALLGGFLLDAVERRK